jgi:hypothetical protein
VFYVTTDDQKVLLAFVPNVDQDKISWFKERTEEIDPGNNQYIFQRKLVLSKTSRGQVDKGVFVF